MSHPPSFARRSRRAFTIIEIIVVLVIIGLMMVIIVPHLLNGRKLRKAQQVKNELVLLNSAIEHYALDSGKVGGTPVTYPDVRKYLDPNSSVYLRNGTDLFGDSYGPFTVGSPPAVPQATAMRLSGVTAQDFWSPFPYQGPPLQ